jgi:hypothetical protein
MSQENFLLRMKMKTVVRNVLQNCLQLLLSLGFM